MDWSFIFTGAKVFRTACFTTISSDPNRQQIAATVGWQGMQQWPEMNQECAQNSAYQQQNRSSNPLQNRNYQFQGRNNQFQNRNNQPQNTSNNQPQNTNSNQRQSMNNNQPQAANQAPVYCDFCGNPRHDVNSCRLRLCVCLICGEPGHVMRKCPNYNVRPGGNPVQCPVCQGPHLGIDCHEQNRPLN